jgi:hypothetical protein
LLRSEFSTLDEWMIASELEIKDTVTCTLVYDRY